MERSRPGNGVPTARLRYAAVAVAIILIGGTIAFMAVERLGLLDALYTTIGAMSTSGELVRPLSPGGRIVAICVVILGVGTLLYTLSALTEYLVEGHFGRAMARRNMDRKIERLHGHAIICGYGRVGRRIAREFAEVHQPFIVVDPQEANIEGLETSGYLHIQGDASADATLLRAGIRRARTLLAATDADTENIAITLSARALAPSLWIVARANRDESESKLRRAGADRVLSPYALGGHRMAGLARRPQLVDFLDTAMQGGDLDLALEEVEAQPGSPLVGISLPANPADLPHPLQEFTIIAIRPVRGTHWVAAGRREGMLVGPGDRLIVLGPLERVRTLHLPAANASASETEALSESAAGP